MKRWSEMLELDHFPCGSYFYVKNVKSTQRRFSIHHCEPDLFISFVRLAIKRWRTSRRSDSKQKQTMKCTTVCIGNCEEMNQSTAVDQSSNDVLLFSTRETFRLTLFACDVTRQTVSPLSLCQILCGLASGYITIGYFNIWLLDHLSIYVAIVGSSLFLDQFFLLGIQKQSFLANIPQKCTIEINQIRIEPKKRAMS